MSKTYKMSLQDTPFQLILNGQKSVEMRLNKGDRKEMCKGDYIVFTSPKGEKITVLVLDIKFFSDFEKLYAYYDKKLLGYKADEIADYHDMEIYYNKEDIKQFGVMGISIKLIK